MSAPVTAYPKQRPGDLPSSPLGFLRERFDAVEAGDRGGPVADAFRRSLDQCERWKRKSGELDMPFHERKARFLREFRLAAEEGMQDIPSWFEITQRCGNLSTFSADISPDVLQGAGPDERVLLSYLDMFMNHDASNSSPRGVVNNGLAFLEGVELYSHLPEPGKVPGTCLDKFRTFSEFLDPYFRYYESISRMGVDFFSSRTELAQAPMLAGDELEVMILAVASGQILRYLETDFRVMRRDFDEALPAQRENVLHVAVDPALEGMRLPLSILGCKLANDTGNCLHAVSRQFRDGNKPLERNLRGEENEAPFVIGIRAGVVTPDVWELRFSDNGRGIVFHNILASLKRACVLDSVFIPPALQDAMARWEAGDPYAFNCIPYGDLMESVFLYGVSGSESITGGMGLWGTTAMLSRLGARIRLGVTPATGGFYESIYLPMNLEVGAERVREVVERTGRGSGRSK